MKDLFEHYETLPPNVQLIIENEPDGYDECREIVTKLNAVGYTCDYGLDGMLFDLRKI